MYLYDQSITLEPFPEFSMEFLDLMESLVAKNLIHRVERSGENRFLMYATIKEFAQQHRAPDGSGEGLARNHFIYFLRLAEQLWPCLRGRGATLSYAQLDAELDNMREALLWALEHEAALGLRLVLALGEYWDTRGMPDEQIYWSTAFCKKLSAANIEVPPVMLALAKMELVRPAFRTNDLARCTALADEVGSIARHLKNDLLLVDSLMPRGMVAAYNGAFAELAPVLVEGLAMSRRSSYEMATVEFLQNSAAAANFAGKFSDSIAYCNEALELAGRLGATRWEAISFSVRGFAQLNLGQIDASADSFNASLRCCKRFMDHVLVIYPLIGKAQIALALAKGELAAQLLGAVERFCERKGTAIVPVVRHMVALTQNAVRAQVGTEEYQRSVDIGRQLQLAEVIDLAEQGSPSTVVDPL
jgi:tetratricopeptide (TPR) repeat protein